MSVLLRKQYSTIKKEKLSEQAKSVLKSMYDTTNGFKDLKATRKIKPKFEAFYNKLKESKPEAIVGGKAKSKAAPKKSADDFQAARARRKSQTGVPKDKRAVDKDATRPAISKRGKRVTDGTHYPYKKGNVYYEYRDNRFDKNPSKYPMLEKGGYMAKGGEMPNSQNLFSLIKLDSKNGHGMLYDGKVYTKKEADLKKDAYMEEMFYNANTEDDMDMEVKIFSVYELLSRKSLPKTTKAKLFSSLQDKQKEIESLTERFADDKYDWKKDYADGGMMAKGGEIEVGDKVKAKYAKYHATVTEIVDNVEVPYAKITYSDGMVKKADLKNLQKVELRVADEYVNPNYMAKGGMMAKGGELSQEMSQKIITYLDSYINKYDSLSNYIVPIKLVFVESFGEGDDLIMVEHNLKSEFEYQIERAKDNKSAVNDNAKDILKIYSKVMVMLDGYMAKGGETKVPNTYIPNRDVQELMVVLKEKSIKLKGSDILDGVYAKNSALKGSKSTKGAKSTTSTLSVDEIFDNLVSKAKKLDDDGAAVKKEDIKKLIDAGYNSKDIELMYLGVNILDPKIDVDYDRSGLMGYTEEGVTRNVKRLVDAAKNNSYEIGLKYPEFNWSSIIKKYNISKKGKEITGDEIKFTNETEYYVYTVFEGDKVAVGTSTNRIRFKDGKKQPEDDYYKKDPKELAAFNGGYWGLVTSSKEVMYDILGMILSQKGKYVKDINVFVNGLGGVGYEELEKNDIKYEHGGKLSKKDFFKIYEENEDQNMHTENVVLLAENYGTESDIRDAKTILAKHEIIGHLPTSLRQERDDLHDKLYAKYVQSREGGGMMEEGGVTEKDKLGLKILKALSGFNDGQTLNGLLELLGYSQYRFGKYATENQVNKVKKELDSLIKMGYVEEAGLGYKETRGGRVYLDSFDYGSYAEGGKTAYRGEVNTFNYRMLDRLRSDNDYYLGNGNRHEKHLWAGNVDGQIAEMKKLWNELPKDKKPEWLSMEDIENYERKMKGNKMADGGGVGRIVMIPTYVVKEIKDSVEMGYDTLVEGTIGRVRKGVMLINDKYEVRGTYDIALKDSIQNLIKKIKLGDFKVDAVSKMADGGMMSHGGETHRLDSIFEDGGEIAEGNLEMAMSNVKAIEHHAMELKSLLDENTSIEAWVVAKLERAETDLSDVTHYIYGLKVEEVQSDTYFDRGGLTKEETLVVAEKYAEALSKSEIKKFTVNYRTLEEDSFDLDMNGIEYDGGSYIIDDNGDVKNMALRESPVYGKTDSTSDEILLNLSKYARGGFVGKAELVWRKLNDSKKMEFLYENFTPQITPRSQEILVGKDFQFLPKDVKIKLEAKYANVEEYARGGEITPYIIWVSKDGEKREMFGEYKSKRAADMKMNKLFESGEYKTIGNKPKSMYVKEGFYGDGGYMADGGMMAKGGELSQEMSQKIITYLDSYINKYDSLSNYIVPIKLVFVESFGEGDDLIMVEHNLKSEFEYQIERAKDNKSAVDDNAKDILKIYSKVMVMLDGYMAKGGEMDDEMVDLFEDYDDIPENVQKVLDKHSDAFENEDYKGLETAKKDLEKIGYTFEYGLDGTAYDLRKIGQKGRSGEEYAKGGRLSRKQKQLDLNKNGKLDSQDFKMLRAGRKNARKK